jgi:hypothetical protein
VRGAGYGEDKTDAVCDICLPSEASGSRDCYIAQNVSTTIRSSKAARFSSFANAKAFAKEKHITFNALTYIGLEDFTDLEMQG